MVWIGFCLIFNYFSSSALPSIVYSCAELSQLIPCVHEFPGLGSFSRVKLSPGPELKGMGGTGMLQGGVPLFTSACFLELCDDKGKRNKVKKRSDFKQIVKTRVVFRIFFFSFHICSPGSVMRKAVFELWE